LAIDTAFRPLRFIAEPIAASLSYLREEFHYFSRGTLHFLCFLRCEAAFQSLAYLHSFFLALRQKFHASLVEELVEVV
jgi:hypothetical protein